jgi:hypothetical protein
MGTAIHLHSAGFASALPIAPIEPERSWPLDFLAASVDVGDPGRPTHLLVNAADFAATKTGVAAPQQSSPSRENRTNPASATNLDR